MKETKRLNSTEKNQESQKRLIRRHLNQMLKGVKNLLNVALIFATLSLILFIIQSWLIADLFSYLVLVSITKTNFNDLIFFYHFLMIVFCLVIRPFLQYFREKYSQYASFLARKKLQQQLISNISRLGSESRMLGSEGVLSSKLIEQLDALDGFISRYYVQVLLVAITPILILAVVVCYSQVAVIIFIMTVPLVIIFMILVGASAADKSRKQFDALSRLSGHFLDLVRGMKTIVHFHANTGAEKVIYKTAEEYRKGTMEVLKLAFLSIGTLEFFASISIAGIALYLGLGLMGEIPALKGVIIVPYQSALFILLLAPEFYAPLRMLGNDYHAKASAEGAIAELIPILEYQAWVHPGNEEIFLQESPAISANELIIYAHSGTPRLKPISFKIEKQERVLIKGPSGVGKSSLLEAILTFIPYQGELFINQTSLQKISRDSWHHNISYLSQAPRIVSGTIAYNLKLAAPEANEEKLWEVLTQVGLSNFILQLPDRLETQLGERGLGLSGGQLGRLSIAQLLLKESLVWLIDEPVEHLDSDTAKLILNLLEQITRGKTVLLISHQNENLEWLDKTIWIE